MRKILISIFSMMFAISPAAYADMEDMWDYFGDQNSYGQEAVSDKDFEEVVQQLEDKKKKKNKKKMKGEEQHQGNETEFLNKVPDELPILSIPVVVKLTDNVELPMGHYQVKGEKKDGKVYLKLYQAHYLIANLPAEETNDDFGQETVNFVKLDEYADGQVIIKYGSVDFNGYVILNVAM